MTKHEVKSWPDYFATLKSGARNFDLRRADRHYKVGDLMIISEFDDRLGKFTGEKLERKITFVLEGVGSGAITPMHGLQRGYVILALAPV